MLSQGSIPRQTGAPEQNELNVQGELDLSRPQTTLRLASGRSVVLPTQLLVSGVFPEDAPAAPSSDVVPVQRLEAEPVSDQAPQGEQVIPLLAEQVEIGKETVTTGTVRLHRSTQQFTETVGLPLTRTAWEVERVPVGALYQERPEIRQDGDVTVYPLVEERLVAKREYFLLEEVRVRRVATTTERSATLQLQRDVLTVDRESGSASPAETPTP